VEHLVVGIARFVLRMSGCRSLKEKRRVLNRVRDRLRSRHNVSVAEVADQDEHRRIVLALCMAGSDARVVEASLRRILDEVDAMYLAPMVESLVRVESWGSSLAGPDLGLSEKY